MISSPLEGALVGGVVPILGTATHPQMQRFELAFGYALDTTDTWFSVQDPAPAPVANDLLGRWDTTGIVDGTYTLRLRVYWTERAFIEAFVRNVSVQNATPTPAPHPTETAPALLPPTELVASATETPEPLIVLPPTSTPRGTLSPAGASGADGGAGLAGLDPQAVSSAFLDGVRLSVIIFVLLGAYAGLRAALRSRGRR